MNVLRCRVALAARSFAACQPRSLSASAGASNLHIRLHCTAPRNDATARRRAVLPRDVSSKQAAARGGERSEDTLGNRDEVKGGSKPPESMDELTGKQLGRMIRNMKRQSNVPRGHVNNIIKSCGFRADKALAAATTAVELNVQLNKYTMDLLAHACSRDAEAVGRCQAIMEQLGIKPDLVTFTKIMMGQAHCGASLQPYVEQLEAMGLEKDLKMYCVLVRNCRSLSELRRWLVEMKEKGVPKDGLFYRSLFLYRQSHLPLRKVATTVIQACGYDATEAYEAAVQALRCRVQPGQEMMNALLKACSRDRTAQQRALSLLRETNTPLDTFSYNSILQGCLHRRELGDLRRYLVEMDEQGVKKDLATYTIAVRAASSWAEARAVLDEMRERDVASDDVFASELVEAVRRANDGDAMETRQVLMREGFCSGPRAQLSLAMLDPDDTDFAVEALNYAIDQRVIVDVVTYTPFVQQCSTFEAGLEYLRHMQANGIKADLVFCRMLLKKPQLTLRGVEEVIERMNNDGIPTRIAVAARNLLQDPGGSEEMPDVSFASDLQQLRDDRPEDTQVPNRLLRKYRKNPEHVAAIFEAMKDIGVTPDASSYATAMYGLPQGSPRLDSLLTEYLSGERASSVLPVNAYLRQCKRVETEEEGERLREVLSKAIKTGMTPDVNTVHAILRHLSDGRSMMVWVRHAHDEHGITPTVQMLRSLVSVTSLEEIQEVCLQLKDMGLKPSLEEFTHHVMPACKGDTDRLHCSFVAMDCWGIVGDKHWFTQVIQEWGSDAMVLAHLMDEIRHRQIPCDVVLYGAAIHARLKVRDTAGAMRYLRAMYRDGVVPSLLIYTDIIAGFRQHPLKQDAMYAELIASGLTPNYATFAAILQLDGQVPNRVTYYYREMVRHGVEPDGSLRKYIERLIGSSEMENIERKVKRVE